MDRNTNGVNKSFGNQDENTFKSFSSAPPHDCNAPSESLKYTFTKIYCISTLNSFATKLVLSHNSKVISHKAK